MPRTCAPLALPDIHTFEQESGIFPPPTTVTTHPCAVADENFSSRSIPAETPGQVANPRRRPLEVNAPRLVRVSACPRKPLGRLLRVCNLHNHENWMDGR